MESSEGVDAEISVPYISGDDCVYASLRSSSEGNEGILFCPNKGIRVEGISMVGFFVQAFIKACNDSEYSEECSGLISEGGYDNYYFDRVDWFMKDRNLVIRMVSKLFVKNKKENTVRLIGRPFKLKETRSIKREFLYFFMACGQSSRDKAEALLWKLIFEDRLLFSICEAILWGFDKFSRRDMNMYEFVLHCDLKSTTFSGFGRNVVVCPFGSKNHSGFKVDRESRFKTYRK
jgi:hypothetical protein